VKWLADILWEVRIGHCGPVARRVARLTRQGLPVRGVGLIANSMIGEPKHDSAAPAFATIDGVKFALDLRQALHRSVYLDLFALQLQRILLPLLRPGDAVIDVGANFGFWSLLAAKRGCTVTAIEPVPPTAELLRKNVRHNGLEDQVRVLPIAVSDFAGQLSLTMPNGESGHASAHAYPSAIAEVFDVRTATLDEIGGQGSFRLLKVDVEGHELAVLHGAEQLLRENRADYLLVELVEGHLRRAGSSSAEIVEYLLGIGYSPIRWVDENEGLWPRRARRSIALRVPADFRGDVLWRANASQR
jgi:FkbM family methyltransferase